MPAAGETCTHTHTHTLAQIKNNDPCHSNYELHSQTCSRNGNTHLHCLPVMIGFHSDEEDKGPLFERGEARTETDGAEDKPAESRIRNL